jgi:hypothetical protein
VEVVFIQDLNLVSEAEEAEDSEEDLDLDKEETINMEEQDLNPVSEEEEVDEAEDSEEEDNSKDMLYTMTSLTITPIRIMEDKDMMDIQKSQEPLQ